jgi:hypothetical protein
MDHGMVSRESFNRKRGIAMKNMTFSDSIMLPALLTLFLFCCASGCAGGMAKKATGEVQVRGRTAQGVQPVSPPQAVYVLDFDLGYDSMSPQQGILHRPAIGRALPLLSQRDDPARKAAKLVEVMSSTLVEKFADKGVDARRVVTGAPLPGNGWLIRGVFTEIDEGSRLKRATIGFGSGATDMEVYVTVSDLAKNPDAPFLVFGTEKDPGKIPGAVVTMNPYVAAAKFVMEKNASEKDVKKTAARIVDEVVKYMQGGTGQ